MKHHGYSFCLSGQLFNACKASSVVLPLLLFVAAGASAQGYSGPLVITKGGTYSGNWQSLDPNVPAVRIQTSEPVVIENANLRGRGTLIEASQWDCKITVRGTRGTGLNPNVTGRAPGRFIRVGYRGQTTIEHCELSNTGGIVVQAPPGAAPAGTLVVRYTRVRNVDGRTSDGNGGWISDATDRGHVNTQFVGIDHARLLASEIAWNEVINEPRESRVEDNINVLVGGGASAADPLRIHDNYIQGAYNGNPTQGFYAGGGINLADGGTSDTGAPGGSTAYVHAYNNQMVSTQNFGVCIAAGHDNKAYNNRVVSSGLLPDGTRLAQPGNPINTTAVGIYVYNIYDTGAFANNAAYDNVVGLLRPDGVRNDWNLSHCAGSCAGNTSLTANPAAPITREMEQAEYQRWRQKLAQNKVTIGPSAGAVPVFSGTYKLTARHSGQALDVSNCSVGEGANVQQYPYWGGDCQQWVLTSVGNGYYRLVSKKSGRALDVSGSGTTNGANVQQWTPNGTPAQRWKIEAATDGHYRLTAECSGKVLDVSDVSQAHGANVHQWEYVGGLNQQWDVRLVSEATMAPALANTITAARPASAVAAPAELTAYPNPARDFLHVALPAASSGATATLTDLLGRAVRFTPLPAARPARLDVRGLAPGAYLLQVQQPGQPARTRRVMVGAAE